MDAIVNASVSAKRADSDTPTGNDHDSPSLAYVKQNNTKGTKNQQYKQQKSKLQLVHS